MAIPLAYNFRSLFVRKATTIATALGVGLVVFVLAASMMLSNGIRETMVSSGSPANALILRKGSDTELASSIENKFFSVVQAAPGVKRDGDGQPLSTGDVVVVVALDRLASGPGQVSNVLVRGVMDNVFKLRPQVKLVQGRPAKPGTDEAIIGKGLLGGYGGLTLGGTFELKKNRAVNVVGVFEAGGSSYESEVWVNIDTLRASFGRDGLFSSITVQLDDPNKYEAFATVVESDKQLGLESFREREYYDKQSEGTSMVISTLGGITAVLFSVGAMIGAMITMYGSVALRSREIGTLRALGFSRFSILVAFLLESTALAALGGLAGTLVSLVCTFFKFSTMNYNTWQEVSFTFRASPGVMGFALAAGCVMGVVGGFLPALRAAYTSPVDAMRA
ncbi:MAG TPA: ABC transporter permease [Polyangiaceae bacterium]|nr:ABC transporter permease [Polyangiaceae bacterium]